MDGPDPALLREDMLDALEHALTASVSESVRNAMGTVPREEFVAEAPYANRTGEQGGSRVFAPATVARFCDALDAESGDDVLVVGSGVGYTVAVLAEIVGPRHVHAIDIDRGMVHEARGNLAAAGYDAVLVDRQDGANGLPAYAPFDRILLEASVVEPPRALREQLAPGGRLVAPVGRGGDQRLRAFDADSDGMQAGDGVQAGDSFGPVSVPPLLAEGEQPTAPTRNRTEREDAEFARQGYFARTGWEQEWIDWDDQL